MNKRLGKIGMQEALSLSAVAACASGIFTTNSIALYGKGNSAYLSIPLSALLSTLPVLISAYAMRRCNANSLWVFFRKGLGAVLARIALLIVALLLLHASSSLLERFMLMLTRFVFPHASETILMLYMLPAVFFLSWLGFEGLGRTARLFIVLFILALFGTFFLASYGYEIHRLAPYLGDGTWNMLQNSVLDMALFLPAAICLLITTQGVHGLRYARRSGAIALMIAGGIGAIAQICLGMTYTYRDLAQMHSPMYRLSMGFRTGGYFPKLDTLLLFGWLLSGVLAVAYYTYCTALFYCEGFDQRDIRPALALFSCAASALALLLHTNAGFLMRASEFLRCNASFIWIGILLICSLSICIRYPNKQRRREANENIYASGEGAEGGHI